MQILLPFRSGYIYAGRDYMRDLPASIEFGFGRRQNCPVGEISCRLSGHISWDWLPIRIYEDLVGDIGSSAIRAAAWTGRYRRFVGFGRWRRSFGVTRIRGARKT